MKCGAWVAVRTAGASGSDSRCSGRPAFCRGSLSLLPVLPGAGGAAALVRDAGPACNQWGPVRLPVGHPGSGWTARNLSRWPTAYFVDVKRFQRVCLPRLWVGRLGAWGCSPCPMFLLWSKRAPFWNGYLGPGLGKFFTNARFDMEFLRGHCPPGCRGVSFL